MEEHYGRRSLGFAHTYTQALRSKGGRVKYVRAWDERRIECVGAKTGLSLSYNGATAGLNIVISRVIIHTYIYTHTHTHTDTYSLGRTTKYRSRKYVY